MWFKKHSLSDILDRLALWTCSIWAYLCSISWLALSHVYECEILGNCAKTNSYSSENAMIIQRKKEERFLWGKRLCCLAMLHIINLVTFKRNLIFCQSRKCDCLNKCTKVFVKMCNAHVAHYSYARDESIAKIIDK